MEIEGSNPSRGIKSVKLNGERRPVKAMELGSIPRIDVVGSSGVERGSEEPGGAGSIPARPIVWRDRLADRMAGFQPDGRGFESRSRYEAGDRAFPPRRLTAGQPDGLQGSPDADLPSWWNGRHTWLRTKRS